MTCELLSLGKLSFVLHRHISDTPPHPPQDAKRFDEQPNDRRRHFEFCYKHNFKHIIGWTSQEPFGAKAHKIKSAQSDASLASSIYTASFAKRKRPVNRLTLLD